jgi:hypothetical protein
VFGWMEAVPHLVMEGLDPAIPESGGSSPRITMNALFPPRWIVLLALHRLLVKRAVQAGDEEPEAGPKQLLDRRAMLLLAR